jgi:hypothetical protein
VCEVRRDFARERDLEPHFRSLGRFAQRRRHQRRRGGSHKCQQRPRGSLTNAGGPVLQSGRRWRSLCVFELDAHVADVSPPALQIFFQASGEQMPDPRRCCRRQRAPVRLPFQDRSDRVGSRLAGKCHASRHHLEEHAAEGPDVGAFVDGQTTRLLRAHVGRRADNRALHVAGRDRWQVCQVAARGVV